MGNPNMLKHPVLRLTITMLTSASSEDFINIIKAMGKIVVCMEITFILILKKLQNSIIDIKRLHN